MASMQRINALNTVFLPQERSRSLAVARPRHYSRLPIDLTRTRDMVLARLLREQRANGPRERAK
jgi:hypothetical protein